MESFRSFFLCVRVRLSGEPATESTGVDSSSHLQRIFYLFDNRNEEEEELQQLGDNLQVYNNLIYHR